MSPSNRTIPILHLYSPASHHEEAYIVANHEGLLAIREVIDKALTSNAPAESTIQNNCDSYKKQLVKINILKKGRDTYHANKHKIPQTRHHPHSNFPRL